MANETNATPPAPEPPAAKGDVKLRARAGYEYRDGDAVFTDSEPVTVSADEAKRLLIKAPDYLVVVQEEKE